MSPKLAISLLFVVGSCAIVSLAEHTPTFGGVPPSPYSDPSLYQSHYADTSRLGAHGSSHGAYDPYSSYNSNSGHGGYNSAHTPDSNSYPSMYNTHSTGLYPSSNYPYSNGAQHGGYNSNNMYSDHGNQYGPHVQTQHGRNMIVQHAKELARSVMQNSRPQIDNLKNDIKLAMSRNSAHGSGSPTNQYQSNSPYHSSNPYQHSSNPFQSSNQQKQGFGQKIVSGVMSKMMNKNSNQGTSTH